MYHMILLCYYVETKQIICDSVNLKCTLALTITSLVVLEGQKSDSVWRLLNKTNNLKTNLTPENVTQHSRIVTTTHKGSSTPTKMSKIIGRQIH